MFDKADQLLRNNLAWFAKVNPQLTDQLSALEPNSVIFHPNINGTDYDLFFGDELALESCNRSLSIVFNEQLKKTDGIAMPRPYKAKDIQSISKSAILSEMVDKHREVILDYLPSIPVLESSDKLSKPIYRNIVIFGSLMLCPLLDYLKNANHCPWISITLVEDDLKQLLATLSLIDLETLVNLCKSKSIGLILHIDELASNLQDRVYHQLSNINPTLLYGWQTLRAL